MPTLPSNVPDWATQTYQNVFSWLPDIKSLWAGLMGALERPCVFYPILIWSLVFTITVTIILSLGFGRNGVIAGSCAAIFQSMVYGGFTPAAGIFATCTGLAMVGKLAPYAALVAGGVATVVAVCASRLWVC